MYASQLDLEAAYGAGLIARLSDNDGDGEADQDAIDSALEIASAIIDGHLAVRYAVPLEQVPVTVRELCIDSRAVPARPQQAEANRRDEAALRGRHQVPGTRRGRKGINRL